jgi:hypothetical protein
MPPKAATKSAEKAVKGDEGKISRREKALKPFLLTDVSIFPSILRVVFS